jgi:hypothetical protein
LKRIGLESYFVKATQGEPTMRRLALPLILLACTALPAMAAETKPKRAPTPAQQAQHERMRQCNATAKEKGLHADPRKAFMKDCLAKHTAG